METRDFWCRKLVSWVLVGFGGAVLGGAVRGQPAEASPSARYVWQKEHDPDGIGKYYQGREIAQVMGHQAADWLERPERQEEERPDLVIQALQLKSGGKAADIGAGTGYYTRRLAEALGPKGTVYAVDIQREMLDLLTNKMAELKLRNVQAILGTDKDPKLPRGEIDLVLLVDVYHEFAYPYEMMRAICQALRPGGRVVFVEFRGEDPKVPIKRLHKMTEGQVRREMNEQPLIWQQTNEVLPWQHIIIFTKK